MPALTNLQTKVCQFIRSFTDENGFPPTRSEISEYFGWKSPNAAEVHVQALKKKGAISSISGYARTLKVLIDV